MDRIKFFILYIPVNISLAGMILLAGLAIVRPVAAAIEPGLLAQSGGGDKGKNSGLLLPDLVTLPPTDLTIRGSDAAGQRVLRLSNHILNRGPGPLEVRGINDPEQRLTNVNQHIYHSEGVILEREAGAYVFHPEHEHWHIEAFASYELWTLNNRGGLAELVGLNDKVSFCLRDNTRFAEMSEVAARPAYLACGLNIQGISTGWVDTYRYHLPGQMIDITGLPDGIYALRSVVDPDGVLWEVSESNNAAVLYIEISGSQVDILDGIEELYERLNLSPVIK